MVGSEGYNAPARYSTRGVLLRQRPMPNRYGFLRDIVGKLGAKIVSP